MSVFRRFSALVSVGVVAVGLVGCTSSDTADSAATGDLAGKKIAYLDVTQSCAYCATQAEAFMGEMQSQGVEVTQSVTNFDAAEQAQQINQAISTRPDLIVIFPTDTTSVIPGLARIKQAGIPVVVTSYPPATEDDSLWTAWVGPDDHKLGVQSAELLIDGLNTAGVGVNGSVIMVTGTPGASSTIARSDGFTETLAQKAPTLRLVGQQPGNWDQTQSTTAAARLFSQYGGDNIVGLYANADNMLAGALVAAERAGYRPGENLIATGSDCTAEGYTNIKSGKQFGTNLQDPFADGKAIAGLATAVLEGNDVPKTTFIDTPAIRQDNVELCAPALG